MDKEIKEVSDDQFESAADQDAKILAAFEGGDDGTPEDSDNDDKTVEVKGEEGEGSEGSEDDREGDDPEAGEGQEAKPETLTDEEIDALVGGKKADAGTPAAATRETVEAKLKELADLKAAHPELFPKEAEAKPSDTKAAQADDDGPGWFADEGEHDSFIADPKTASTVLNRGFQRFATGLKQELPAAILDIASPMIDQKIEMALYVAENPEIKPFYQSAKGQPSVVARMAAQLMQRDPAKFGAMSAPELLREVHKRLIPKLRGGNSGGGAPARTGSRPAPKPTREASEAEEMLALVRANGLDD